jgi:hypothetical protein
VSQSRNILDGHRRSVPHESFDDAEPFAARKSKFPDGVK